MGFQEINCTFLGSFLTPQKFDLAPERPSPVNGLCLDYMREGIPAKGENLLPREVRISYFSDSFHEGGNPSFLGIIFLTILS